MTVSKDKSGTPSGKKFSSAASMEPVYALWDELEQFPAKETDLALEHLARGMKTILRADNVKWMATVRVLQGRDAAHDKLNGWRIRSTYDLFTHPLHHRKTSAFWFRRDNKVDENFLIGHATLAMVAAMGAGKFQSHRMRDGWIPWQEFRRSEHFQIHYAALDITDRMWLSVPVNASTESMFLVDRHGASPRFSKGDEILASTMLQGIRWFHRRLFLDRGLLLGQNELSPVFRRIVQKLLTGMSEKEIACALNQAPATTHKYIKTIYERFGVNGRAGLLALWLGS